MGLKLISIFLFLASFWAQGAFADCNKALIKLQDSTDFVSRWEKAIELRNESKDVPKTLILQVVESATKALDNHGIKWIQNPEREHSLIILPSKKITAKTIRKMPLDQFARYAQVALNKVQVEFNPEELLKDDVGALFIDADNRLVLSDEEIVRGYITDQGLHEGAGHGYFAKLLTGDQDKILFGSVVSRSEKIKFHETYQNEFALDELYSYSIQITDIIKDYIELLEKKGEQEDVDHLLNQLTDILKTQITLSKATQKAAMSSLRAIKSLAKGLRTWTEFKGHVEGIGPEVVGYEKDNYRVYVYRDIEGPTKFKEYQRPTFHTVVSVGAIDLNLLLLDNKILSKNYPTNEALEIDVIQKTKTKIEKLREITARLPTHYSEILRDIKKGNLSNALERSKTLSSMLLL